LRVHGVRGRGIERDEDLEGVLLPAYAVQCGEIWNMAEVQTEMHDRSEICRDYFERDAHRQFLVIDRSEARKPNQGYLAGLCRNGGQITRKIIGRP
jgi:hypothetical protein